MANVALASQLEQFVPIGSLSRQTLADLSREVEVLTYPAGASLFRKGDEDDWLYFLLEGSVRLSDPGGSPITLTAGTEDARYAMARLKPRRYDGSAVTPVRLLRVGEKRLDRYLTLDKDTGYEVFEFDVGDDPEWVFQLISLPAFQDVPLPNINAILACCERRSYRAGEVVLRQGEPGDYYYLIREGRAQVSRRLPDGRSVILAELGPRDGFGEDALISGEPRNATVTMLTDGVLMRLATEQFNKWLKTPMVKWVDEAQFRRLLAQGAILIDVRMEDEYRRDALKGSINLPLHTLRDKLDTLRPKLKYLVYCQSGQRAAAAAFVLEQHGFEAYALEGGLSRLRH